MLLLTCYIAHCASHTVYHILYVTNCTSQPVHHTMASQSGSQADTLVLHKEALCVLLDAAGGDQKALQQNLKAT